MTQSQQAQKRRPPSGSAKKFFKMKDVCEMTGLEPHVLRFWESEFAAFSPKKNRAGHRIFSHEDVELVRSIQSLLHEQGFTIAGAQKKLEGGRAPGDEESVEKPGRQKLLEEVRAVRGALEEVMKLLDAP